MAGKLMFEKFNDLQWELDRVSGLLDTDLPEYKEPHYEDCGRDDVISYIDHLHGVIEDLIGYMNDAKKELVG